MPKARQMKRTICRKDIHFHGPQPKQSFAKFIHNGAEGTYFGRTPLAWIRTLLFYMGFFSALTTLCALCMLGFQATYDLKEPKWKLEESLIGTSPGLGFRPISEETERGSLIQFDAKEYVKQKYWIELLDEFIQTYNQRSQIGKKCFFNGTRNETDVCSVDVNQLGSCVRQNAYGYNDSRPCVFIKLNKIYNWVPQCYDDRWDLPLDMPDDLKEYIQQMNPSKRQQVWVSCDGTTAEDRENLGEVKFYPAPGFPNYYYPYRNQPGYLSPLIAVKFESLPLNKMVNVECRAWAKNIIYNGKIRDRMGSVTFQILID